MLRLLLTLLQGYLLGCLVAGYYVVRMLDGRDIRALGSGNAGATNVRRSHGRGAAAVTLAFDALKAVVAVAVGRWLLGADWGGALALAAVIAGHVWPVQLRFRGGKGAASALGGFLWLAPLAAALALSIGLVAYAISRRYVASGLLAVVTAPAMLALTHFDVAEVAIVLVAAAIALVAHALPGRTPVESR